MQSDTRLVKHISYLRWMIPIIVLVFGSFYMFFDDVVIEGHPIEAPFIIIDALVFGVVGAVCAWMTLTWARKAALAEADAQKETKLRALALEAATHATQKVTSILNEDKLVSQVVKEIRDAFGYYHVALFLVDTSTQELVLREGLGQAQSTGARGLRLKIGEQGITGHVAQTGKPILCNDVTREPRYYPHDLVPDTQSELAVPLRRGNTVIGVFDVQSYRRNAFRTDDIAVLQILADQVVSALENARLFKEARQQFQVMRVLHDISLDITAQLDSHQVLSVILEQAAHLLNAEASNLAVYDRATGLARVIATHNLPPEFKQLTFPQGEGLIGQVVAAGKPVIINKYREWEKRSRHIDSPVHDAIVGAPLRWQGEVFGVLAVGDRSERRVFDDNDAALLALFADLASIALKNSELYERIVVLSQDLEHKVEERTGELVLAREDITRKAEQLQRLLAVTVQIQEEARARIARDLHDGSNQLITGATYELQAARESLLNQHPEVTLEKLETTKELLRKIDAENRRIILGLRPPILDAQGLLPALNWYANSFSQQYRIACSVQASGEPIRLSPEVEIAAYRIVQESLNNISTHAQALQVQIHANFGPSELSITVKDDGVGFDYARALKETSGQMGLIGMNERAQSIGAQMTVESGVGQGTRITLRVPIKSSELADPKLREFSQEPVGSLS